MCIYQDIRKVGPFAKESRKIGSFIYFLLKKREQIIYLEALKKGAIQHAHPYYAIYRKLPHPMSCPIGDTQIDQQGLTVVKQELNQAWTIAKRSA